VALDQSVLLEVLDALTAAEVDDRIRQAAQTIYQALIEAELTAVIGAGPHERTPERLAQGNGHRSRLLATTAGDLELRIPSCGPGRSSPACWSGAAGLTRRCSRWSWRPTCMA
jgi:putative transposase